MSIVTKGKKPYWMYSFTDESEDHRITIWFTNNTNDDHFPASVEIHELTEGKCYFNGHIYNIDDLKKVLYLIFDCIDKNGYSIVD